jgi:hypothetical protein
MSEMPRDPRPERPETLSPNAAAALLRLEVAYGLAEGPVTVEAQDPLPELPSLLPGTNIAPQYLGPLGRLGRAYGITTIDSAMPEGAIPPMGPIPHTIRAGRKWTSSPIPPGLFGATSDSFFINGNDVYSGEVPPPPKNPEQFGDGEVVMAYNSLDFRTRVAAERARDLFAEMAAGGENLVGNHPEIFNPYPDHPEHPKPYPNLAEEYEQFKRDHPERLGEYLELAHMYEALAEKLNARGRVGNFLRAFGAAGDKIELSIKEIENGHLEHVGDYGHRWYVVRKLVVDRETKLRLDYYCLEGVSQETFDLYEKSLNAPEDQMNEQLVFGKVSDVDTEGVPEDAGESGRGIRIVATLAEVAGIEWVGEPDDRWTHVWAIVNKSLPEVNPVNVDEDALLARYLTPEDQ